MVDLAEVFPRILFVFVCFGFVYVMALEGFWKAVAMFIFIFPPALFLLADSLSVW